MSTDPKLSISSEVYFIRHDFNDLKFAEYCEKGSLIAIYFCEKVHEQIEDYSADWKGFKNAFKTLRKLGENGGLVVIEYVRGSGKFYIATVRPDSEIQCVEQDGFLFKALPITDRLGPFDYSENILLSALRPRKTISPMYGSARNMALFIKDRVGNPIPFQVGSLHPKALEQMCEEWLRLNQDDPMKYGLLKTGLTLPNIDIYGVSLSRKEVFAQVTHETNAAEVQKKFAQLEKYAKSSSEPTVWYFGPRYPSPKGIEDSNVKFKAIEDVFMELGSGQHQEMLEKMIALGAK